MRMLGDNVTLMRCAWEELLDNLKEGELKKRIAERITSPARVTRVAETARRTREEPLLGMEAEREAQEREAEERHGAFKEIEAALLEATAGEDPPEEQNVFTRAWAALKWAEENHKAGTEVRLAAMEVTAQFRRTYEPDHHDTPEARLAEALKDHPETGDEDAEWIEEMLNWKEGD